MRTTHHLLSSLVMYIMLLCSMINRWKNAVNSTYFHFEYCLETYDYVSSLTFEQIMEHMIEVDGCRLQQQ
jgi:hypothetical protein